MIQIHLCPSCWKALEPALHRAALDERALLQSIASRLTKCKACRVQGNKLRAAAKTLTIEMIWEAVIK